jgi:hypothetical protein
MTSNVLCREGCFSCALIVHYIGTFVVMLVIETNICNDIRELMITATYNGILFSVFRDLESRDQRCTKCDQYERALAKLKKQNQELQDRYHILYTILIKI